MAKKTKTALKKKLKKFNVQLTPREKQYFIGASQETVSFICPVRGSIKQKVIVKKFRAPHDLPTLEPKYTIKMEDDMILDEEDFSGADLKQMLDGSQDDSDFET